MRTKIPCPLERGSRNCLSTFSSPLFSSSPKIYSLFFLPRCSSSLSLFLSLSLNTIQPMHRRCTCTGILCTKKKKEKKKGVGTGFLSILIRLPCQYFRSTIHSSGSSPSFRSISIFLLLLLPDLRLNCTR